VQRPVGAIRLDARSCTDSLLRQGGTILGTTNKGSPFSLTLPDGRTKDVSDDIIEGYSLLGLDALIGIGGDGSQAILRKIAQRGKMNLITIPKTIDDDLSCTEHSIGFMTAVSTATEAIDRLHPQRQAMAVSSFWRLWDAMQDILPFQQALQEEQILFSSLRFLTKSNLLTKKIRSLQDSGKNHSLIVVSEAVKMESGEKSHIIDSLGNRRYGGIAYYLANRITELTGMETRFTVLGHTQRGAQPVFQDRILASAFGVYSVDLVAKGKFDRMVAWKDGTVIDIPIEDAIKGYRAVDIKGVLVKTALGLGISFGHDDI
jgi:6-phosphofructokinase